MNEYQILMHARSVNNLLADRKTQTRRVLKPKPPDKKKNPMTGVLQDTDWHAPWFDEKTNEADFSSGFGMSTKVHRQKCPYGGPGSLLYVRETFQLPRAFDDYPPKECRPGPVRYVADGATPDLRDDADGPLWGRTRASIHMPKWASRIWLRVEDVRVERVQDISEEDIMAEGVHPVAMGDDYPLKPRFKKLWNDTHSHQLEEFGWAANPWVWVIEFEVVSKIGRPRAVPHYA